MSAHREPAYLREPWRSEHRNALAISEEVSDDGLILPLYGDMTDEDQVYVAAVLARAIRTEDQQLCP
jgi:dTDP-4-amino-4,6-dideoxygalactose transaminase